MNYWEIVMKVSELIDKNIYAEGLNTGKVLNAIVDMEKLKITHLDVELTKLASEEILGVTPSIFRPAKNSLAISALEKGRACCSDRGLEVKVSKAQLDVYLTAVGKHETFCLKFGDIIDKKIYAGDYFVGKVKDLYVDEEWKITHLEVELTKEAAKDLLGGISAIRNSLAISALEKWPDCCKNDQLQLCVSKAQLNIYHRPPK